MRAVRVAGNSIVVDPAAQDPRPAPNECVVRPRLVALAGGDLPNAARGSWIIGRACVGDVEAFHGGVAPADAAAWKGRRAVLAPDIPCGACDECRAGLPAHCRHRVTLGTPARDGCLAERVAVPLASLHAVPDHVADEQAVLAVPVAAALHAARVSHAHAGAYATVLGDSIAAMLATQALRRTHPAVRLLGADPARLAVAERLGIRCRPLDEAGRRRDQALVIECTGTTDGLATALRLLRPRGRLVLTLPVSGDLAHAVRDEIDITCARAAPVHDALAALSRGEIDTTGLITRRLRLDGVPRAIPALSTELGVVVELA